MLHGLLKSFPCLNRVYGYHALFIAGFIKAWTPASSVSNGGRGLLSRDLQNLEDHWVIGMYLAVYLLQCSYNKEVVHKVLSASVGAKGSY